MVQNPKVYQHIYRYGCTSKLMQAVRGFKEGYREMRAQHSMRTPAKDYKVAVTYVDNKNSSIEQVSK